MKRTEQFWSLFCDWLKLNRDINKKDQQDMLSKGTVQPHHTEKLHGTRTFIFIHTFHFDAIHLFK